MPSIEMQLLWSIAIVGLCKILGYSCSPLRRLAIECLVMLHSQVWNLAQKLPKRTARF